MNIHSCNFKDRDTLLSYYTMKQYLQIIRMLLRVFSSVISFMEDEQLYDLCMFGQKREYNGKGLREIMLPFHRCTVRCWQMGAGQYSRDVLAGKCPSTESGQGTNMALETSKVRSLDSSLASLTM